MITSLLRLRNIILSPLFVGIIFFLFLQLQFFNLNIDFRDEGLLLSNAVRINSGEIPYRDFPLITTPGTYYIQSFAMKIFGDYIITDRIIYILFFLYILSLCSNLFRLPHYLSYVYLISLSVIYFGRGAYAFYNIEGLALILSALLIFKKYREKNNLFHPFLIGALSSLSFVFKQSYGISSIFIFLLLITFFTKRNMLIKNIISYFGGVAAIFIPFFIYFYVNNALDELIYYIFYFSGLAKSHRLPFIVTILFFIPFITIVFNFLKRISIRKIIFVLFFTLGFFCLYLLISPQRINYLSSTFKDLSTYYFLLFLILPLMIINLSLKIKNKQDEQILIISIISFCLFLASASSGRDYATVVVVSPLYIPLFIFISEKLFNKSKIIVKNIVLTLTIFIFIFPSINYLFMISDTKYRNEVMYEKILGKESKYIMIPQSQSKDLNNIISYVNNLSPSPKKMLCFPYCPMLNYLSKLDNVSYFNFFYPETFRIENQNRVIGDLQKTKEVVILIQKPGLIEKEADFEDNRLTVLKKYIINNYKLDKTFENFYIYRDVKYD